MSTTKYTPDEVLDKQARRQMIAIEHLRRYWHRSCRCSICQSADRRMPQLVTWRANDPERQSFES